MSAKRETDGGVAIVVRDTGIGIAEDNLVNVLNPFVQVEEPFNRSYQGAGLGLPLAKSLVNLHGGALLIDSTLGKGTAVTVRLPPERILAAG